MFKSFFMGGFECADHINRSGERISLLRETEHDLRVEEDYRLLLDLGIKTVREGLCWSDVEGAPYCYDFSGVRERIDIAARLGIQQIWDVCHFGYPDGIYPTHPHFCARFAALCKAFALFYKAVAGDQLFVVPINEISFLAWHSGDVRGTVPFLVHCGFDLKYHLCKAAIAGIANLRAVLPGCRILLIEPMIRIHPGTSSNDIDLFNLNEAQFQAMDIIAGRMCPELGGAETNLDILGVNYYWDCQWQHEGPPLPWPEAEFDTPAPPTPRPLNRAAVTSDYAEPVQQSAADSCQPRRVTLVSLLAAIQERYKKPLFIAETGHFGSGRARWLDELTSECMRAVESHIDLRGICIYPVIDRPDWDELGRYHNSGIWDLDASKNRVAAADYLAMVRSCVSRMAELDPALPRNFLVPS